MRSDVWAGLWKLEIGGPNVFRRAERRLALSLEYGVKAGYGAAIRQATASVYAPEDLTILARAEGVFQHVQFPQQLLASFSPYEPVFVPVSTAVPGGR